MDVPFDPRWDRLPQLFAGVLPEDEAQALQHWIDADPERRETVARLREVWRLTAVPPRPWDVEAGLASIHRQTVEEKGRVIARVGPRSPLAMLQRSRRGGLVAAIGIAAALLLVAGGAAFWQSLLRPLTVAQPAVTSTEFATRRGQRLALRLADGTLVILAPGSTLRQPSTYGRTDRTLFLDGEAYFVVTHDSTRPFAVHTTRTVARDLGTRFVVRAYAADPATDVVVAEGVVAVGRADRAARDTAPLSGDRVVLTRGQRARVTPDGRVGLTRGVALDPYLGWTEGRLVFRDTPLAEAARQLSRWHDVEVRLADPRTAARRVTASFDEEPIADVIHRIATSLDLEVTRTDRTFTLRAR